MIKLKRIYEKFENTDGYRILVDRLWPRGVSKEEADIDLWMKEIAPTPALRVWFNHDEKNWKIFRLKYIEELKNNDTVNKLIQIIREHKIVTLLYATKNEIYNHPIVLREFLLNKMKK